MINLIQPITVQQAYDAITHARWWASWNWWWRMVDDDDGDETPLQSPKRSTNLASWWRTGAGGGSISWNTIILSPWFFSQKIGFYSNGDRVSGATRWAQPIATSWACVGFSLEEERVMHQSRDKYFPQFENQGINPVGGEHTNHQYLHKQSNNLHPTR